MVQSKKGYWEEMTIVEITVNISTVSNNLHIYYCCFHYILFVLSLALLCKDSYQRQLIIMVFM